MLPRPPQSTAPQAAPSALLAAAAVSPSLRAWIPGEPRAYEMKFVLSEGDAARVEELVRPRLALDPHADPGLGNAYRTTTLYCDTPQREVLRRLGAHKRRKYRLRRYGDGQAVFLERKNKRGERVQKRRTTIAGSELPLLADGDAQPDWPGRWFQEQTRRRGLLPALRVHYLRTAYFGATAEGPIRVTFDRDVRGIATADWCVAPFDGGAAVMEGLVICEFKFRGTLPASLRAVIQALRLTPRGVSKYRHCAAACGLEARHA